MRLLISTADAKEFASFGCTGASNNFTYSDCSMGRGFIGTDCNEVSRDQTSIVYMPNFGRRDA